MIVRQDILLVFYFLQLFYSSDTDLLSNDLSSIVDQLILRLNKTDLSHNLGLEALNHVILGLSSDNETEKYEFSKLFYDRGGIDVIQSWFDFFQRQNHTQVGSLNLTKTYVGQTLVLIYLGSEDVGFNDKMVESGLLKSLLRFMSSPMLFSDMNFSEDFFAVSSLIVVKIDEFYLYSSVNRIIYEMFGPNFRQLYSRFLIETDWFAKLLIGELLARQKLSGEMDVFSANLRFLMATANTVKSAVNNSDVGVIYSKIKTSYFNTTFQMSGFQLLKLFTNFLLSKQSRRLMCDESFFQLYFSIIQKCSSENPNFNDFNWFCILSLRALFILSQTCGQYHDYFHPSHRECKSKFEIDISLNRKNPQSKPKYYSCKITSS